MCTIATNNFLLFYQPQGTQLELSTDSLQKSPSNVGTMITFLEAHGRKEDPVLGDGNCLFRSLCAQMTGDQSQHAKLRQILVSFAKTGEWGSHAEIKAAASLFQRPIYVATDLLKCTWTVFTPFHREDKSINYGNHFITKPKVHGMRLPMSGGVTTMEWSQFVWTHI